MSSAAARGGTFKGTCLAALSGLSEILFLDEFPQAGAVPDNEYIIETLGDRASNMGMTSLVLPGRILAEWTQPNKIGCTCMNDILNKFKVNNSDEIWFISRMVDPTTNRRKPKPNPKQIKQMATKRR
jgi:hypothetical protein